MSVIDRVINNVLTFRDLSYVGEKATYATTVGTYECNLQSVDAEYSVEKVGLSKEYMAFIFQTGLPITSNQQVTDKDGFLYTVKGIEEYEYGTEIDHTEVTLVRGKETGTN